MKAVILHAPGQMHLGEWPTPQCGPWDVLIAPIAAGICAGDMYLYAGRNPYASYPLIGGHEVCGRVTQIGGEVTRVVPGEIVVIEPVVGCGRCYPCRQGKPNCCENFCLIGLHRPGGYAELCLAPESNVHKVPPNVPPLLASFAEPLTIGLHACRRARVQPGEYVLVLGAGPIGLAAAEVARLLGARVVVTDVNQERLKFVERLGAEGLKSDDRLPARVREQTGGDGAAVVIEATGNVQAIQSTIELVASGGRIVIIGLVKKGVGVTFPGLDFTRKEVTLLGSRNSVGCFPETLALLASGQIHYPEMATTFRLWEAPAIFAKLAAEPDAVHKGVLLA